MTHYEPGLGIGIAAHVVIAVAFVVIAVVVMPKFRFFGPRALGTIARYAGAVFLASSALLHAELAAQGIAFGVATRADPRGVGAWYVEWHGVAVACVEAVAAVTFLVLCLRFLSTVVINRAAVTAAIDERIRQYEQEIARRERLREQQAGT